MNMTFQFICGNHSVEVLARKSDGGAELPMNGEWAGSEVQVSLDLRGAK
ncbi:MAG: hypothetical protein JWR51_358 [Devosia sp.]|nr:hypothetical protein [Devosia sp.]MDB5527255.1 hypothetical protein [Devosia sp.]